MENNENYKKYSDSKEGKLLKEASKKRKQNEEKAVKKLKLFNGEALTNENNAAEANKGKDKDEKKLKLDNGL